MYDIEIRTNQHPIVYHTGDLHLARYLWNDGMLQLQLNRLVQNGYVMSSHTPHGLRFVLVVDNNKRHPHFRDSDV